MSRYRGGSGGPTARQTRRSFGVGVGVLAGLAVITVDASVASHSASTSGVGSSDRGADRGNNCNTIASGPRLNVTVDYAAFLARSDLVWEWDGTPNHPPPNGWWTMGFTGNGNMVCRPTTFHSKVLKLCAQSHLLSFYQSHIFIKLKIYSDSLFCLSNHCLGLSNVDMQLLLHGRKARFMIIPRLHSTG